MIPSQNSTIPILWFLENLWTRFCKASLSIRRVLWFVFDSDPNQWDTAMLLQPYKNGGMLKFVAYHPLFIGSWCEHPVVRINGRKLRVWTSNWPHHFIYWFLETTCKQPHIVTRMDHYRGLAPHWSTYHQIHATYPLSYPTCNFTQACISTILQSNTDHVRANTHNLVVIETFGLRQWASAYHLKPLC